MSKKTIFIVAVLSCMVVGYFIYKSAQLGNSSLEEKTSDSPIVFYYGYSCPHCKIVEDFIKQNAVDQKIDFSMKEVYKNKNNAKEMAEKAGKCGIKQEDLGVPFLWDGEKCFVGDKDIISFFEGKIKTQEESGTAEDKCKKLEEETSLELKKIADEANYCSSDLDCVDNKIVLDCPFGCQTYLTHKNADVSNIKNLIGRYYENCPVCSLDCQTQKVMQEYIKCRNKKCEIQYPDNSENMMKNNDNE